MAFTCQICFEECTKRLALPRLTTGNGDVLREKDCNHPICQDCLSMWITSRVEEQFVFNLKCPIDGCTNEMFEQDVTKLASSGPLKRDISQRFTELRTRDYTARAADLCKELQHDTEEKVDYDGVLRLWQTMRLCPRCSLAIERSAGCNSFYCICGHHFDFAAAPRVVGDGIRNFGSVIEVAKGAGIALADAQKYGGSDDPDKKWSKSRAIESYRLATEIAAALRVSLDEAWDINTKARSGDEEARMKIRHARGRVETSNQTVGDSDDEVLDFLVWDNSETPEISKETNEDAVEKAPEIPDKESEELTMSMLLQSLNLEKMPFIGICNKRLNKKPMLNRTRSEPQAR